jgi:phage gpG-like protein
MEFKAKGFTDAINNMRQRRTRLADFTSFHKKAAIQILGWVFKNFQKDGGLHDDKSLKWPLLSPATIARRKQGNPAILRDTGRLRGGFESRANRSEAVIENKVEYAIKHELGTSRIPQRKMFPMQDQAEDIILPVMREHIRKSV